MKERKGGTKQIAIPDETPAKSLSFHQISLQVGHGVETCLPTARDTQCGARLMKSTPMRFNHPVQVIPPLTPFFSTNHELDRLPIKPPTVYTAVTRPYRWVSRSRHSGSREDGAESGVEHVREVAGKFSSDRW